MEFRFDPWMLDVDVNATQHDYSKNDYSKEKPHFVEVCKDHFVLANSIEVEKYKKEIEEIDKKNK